MARFLIGLVLGASASAITWVATDNRGWAAVAGVVVLVLVWLGEWILDDLL
ncbi:MAG TPA: hypothetical protein VI172_05835 [Candidatus Dormibacteraeota bacterium]|jgi:hypothetical protein